MDFSITVPFTAATSTHAANTNIKLENLDQQSKTNEEQKTAQIVTHRRPSFSQAATTPVPSTQIMCGQVTSGTSVVNIMRTDGSITQSTKESTLSSSPPSLGSPASMGDEDDDTIGSMMGTSSLPAKPNSPETTSVATSVTISSAVSISDTGSTGSTLTSQSIVQNTTSEVEKNRKPSVEMSTTQQASVQNVLTGDGVVVGVVTSSAMSAVETNVLPPPPLPTHCKDIISTPASGLFSADDVKRETTTSIPKGKCRRLLTHN